MSRIYEGTVLLTVNAKGYLALGTGKAAVRTAADAQWLLATALEAAEANSIGLDRWSFYVEGLNESLKGDSIPAAAVEKWAKAHKGHTVALDAAKWGKPRLTLRPKGSNKAGTTTKRDRLVII